MSMPTQVIADISALSPVSPSGKTASAASTTSDTDFAASLTALSKTQETDGGKTTTADKSDERSKLHKVENSSSDSDLDETATSEMNATHKSDDLLARIQKSREQSTDVKVKAAASSRTELESLKRMQAQVGQNTENDTSDIETDLTDENTATSNQLKLDSDIDTETDGAESLDNLTQLIAPADQNLMSQIAALQMTNRNDTSAANDISDDASEVNIQTEVDTFDSKSKTQNLLQSQLIQKKAESEQPIVDAEIADTTKQEQLVGEVDASLTAMSDSLAASQAQAEDISDSKSTDDKTAESEVNTQDTVSKSELATETVAKNIANQTQQTNGITLAQMVSNKPAVQMPVSSSLTQSDDTTQSRNDAKHSNDLNQISDSKQDKTADVNAANSQVQQNASNPSVQNEVSTQPTAENMASTSKIDMTTMNQQGQLGASAPQNAASSATQAVQNRLESVYVNNQQLDETAMASRVMYMVTSQLKEAEIALNPEGLGNVKVKLSMDEQTQQTNIHFVTQTAQAKDVLDQSLTKLRDMMGQQGLQLGQSSVQHQSAGQQQSGSQAWQQFADQGTDSGNGQNGRSQTSGGSNLNGESDTESAQSVSYTSTIDDGVDFYA